MKKKNAPALFIEFTHRYYYILGSKNRVTPVDDVRIWAEWMQRHATDNRRQVALTHIKTRKGEITVSTVFVGVDASVIMSNNLHQRPNVFETSVFAPGVLRGFVMSGKWPTWSKASAGHDVIVNALNDKINAREI